MQRFVYKFNLMKWRLQIHIYVHMFIIGFFFLSVCYWSCNGQLDNLFRQKENTYIDFLLETKDETKTSKYIKVI